MGCWYSTVRDYSVYQKIKRFIVILKYILHSVVNFTFDFYALVQRIGVLPNVETLKSTKNIAKGHLENMPLLKCVAFKGLLGVHLRTFGGCTP